MRLMWGKSGIATILAVIALLAMAECGEQAKWQVLSPQEVQDLFARSTVSGHHEVYGYDFVSYYDSRGWFHSDQGEERGMHDGKWWTVSGENNICIHWAPESGDLCRRIVRGRDGRYLKLKGSKTVVTYWKFQRGTLKER